MKAMKKYYSDFNDNESLYRQHSALFLVKLELRALSEADKGETTDISFFCERQRQRRFRDTE